MNVPRQLALALPHAESFARDDFLTGTSNSAALSLIERWPDWPDRALAVVGPEGSGKSHLAAIWAEIAGARRVSARALGETDQFGELRPALVLEDASAKLTSGPCFICSIWCARKAIFADSPPVPATQAGFPILPAAAPFRGCGERAG